MDHPKNGSWSSCSPKVPRILDVLDFLGLQYIWKQTSAIEKHAPDDEVGFLHIFFFKMKASLVTWCLETPYNVYISYDCFFQVSPACS